jgi:glycosyltransferase involved in cell wall biosynthesis
VSGTPLVSGICPVYNCEKYVERAIKSVVEQEYPNWELLLIDDGSADNSWGRIKEWSKSDNRIVALHHPQHANLGVSATRNLGISRAHGEFLAFLDADDEWLPHKLARQVEVMTRHPDVGLVYGQALCVDENSKPLTMPRSIWKLEGVIGSGLEERPVWAYRHIVVDGVVFPPSPTVLARTNLVKECGGFRLGLGHQIEDYLLWTELSRLAPFYYMPTTLAFYRIGTRSWTSLQTVPSKREADWEYIMTLAKAFGGADSALSRRAARMISGLFFPGEAERAKRFEMVASALRRVLADPHFGSSGKLSVLLHLTVETLPAALMKASRHRLESWLSVRTRRIPAEDTVKRV